LASIVFAQIILDKLLFAQYFYAEDIPAVISRDAWFLFTCRIKNNDPYGNYHLRIVSTHKKRKYDGA